MAEDLGIFVGREITVLPARLLVHGDHAVDQLLEAPLALGGADRTAEVLGGHDVGRVDRPEVRELYATLLEIDRAVPPVRHYHVPALPGDLVVRVDARRGVDTRHPEPAVSLL